MSRKHPEVAIAYDFDGTLSPGNLQEYDFIPKLGMKKGDFWRDAMQLAKDCDGDPILAYLNLMLRKANANEVPIRRQDFVDYGKGVELFPGVEEWFDRIDAYGKQLGLSVKHYIISSGIREMVEGSPVAKKFERVFASAYAYDQNGVAYAPALAINYTTKTQYLFRINKGTLDAWDNSRINAYVRQEERPVPFERMLYLGDGETDVPCMRTVKDLGGHSMAVYKPKRNGAKALAGQLMEEGRVNFVAPADYRDGKTIDNQVKAVLERIAAEVQLDKLGRR
ncbi:MAG: HAD family hydrolase [Candidatus Thiodiazotropha sp. 6PLUC9]